MVIPTIHFRNPTSWYPQKKNVVPNSRMVFVSQPKSGGSTTKVKQKTPKTGKTTTIW